MFALTWALLLHFVENLAERFWCKTLLNTAGIKIEITRTLTVGEWVLAKLDVSNCRIWCEELSEALQELQCITKIAQFGGDFKTVA